MFRDLDFGFGGGLEFTVTPSTFDETSLDKKKFKHPKEFVMECAKQKALNVEKRLNGNQNKRIVIAADTIVVSNGEILEKPHTKENALLMLTRLNAKTHEVYSGVAMIITDPSNTILTFVVDLSGRRIGKCGNFVLFHEFFECTKVEFGDIPPHIIAIYAASEEPLDKAGAYGIQDNGGTLIKKINGCFYNVQGFPLYKFCEEVYNCFKVNDKNINMFQFL
ncbi:dTTP/UTP pyrophosphatase isoform X3 [Hydra vulgaris]|uniref:dTTP/UTP pyrophosphatase isoform X3 n=1 Tax=Hydra vulgaris TaxID=6087 RepID=UPI001F5E5960|nr:dTTP/UTP pyrophosphatase-like isoform X3 [Hydra vulgaris]